MAKRSGSPPKLLKSSDLKVVSRQTPGPNFYVPLNIAFSLCFVSHVVAALYAPIQDCDETFNYWEPLHYINHGYGKQTWEYSPEYAIRTYFYIILHAIPAKLGALFATSKTTEFYLLRALLAACCAATETRLYSAISRTLNPRIGVIYLVIVAFTPGIFYASVALLPSSFAMYTSALGLAAFMDWQGGIKTIQGVVWFGTGAIVGWPFAGALIIPFVAEEAVRGIVMKQKYELFRRFALGVTGSVLILAIQCLIDGFFYKKILVVPWQIVFYNVFSGKDRGPNIFGTEPWHYYARNLLLNFNMWFLLACTAILLVLLQYIFPWATAGRKPSCRPVVFVLPFYIWMGIFTLQPHKEERFMYPAYPFLALNAAISFHVILAYLGTSRPKFLMSKIPAKLKLVTVLLLVATSVAVGLLRIIGTVTAYRAPLQIYAALDAPGMAHPDRTVCLGKDWYRFPASHFLPNGMHAQFIKSEFSGLLPGDYREGKAAGFGFFPGTWLVPPGMNDRNEEDVGKYMDLKSCTYLVDTSFPSVAPSELEPDYGADAEVWEKVSCAKFLDAGRTHVLARTIWVPDLPPIPVKYRRKWGEHCLLRRRQ